MYILFSNTDTYVQPKGPILLLLKSIGAFAFASWSRGRRSELCKGVTVMVLLTNHQPQHSRKYYLCSQRYLSSSSSPTVNFAPVVLPCQKQLVVLARGLDWGEERFFQERHSCMNIKTPRVLSWVIKTNALTRKKTWQHASTLSNQMFFASTWIALIETKHEYKSQWLRLYLSLFSLLFSQWNAFIVLLPPFIVAQQTLNGKDMIQILHISMEMEK